MDKLSVPVKVVMRSTGEIVKIVLKAGDVEMREEDEERFWIAPEESQEDWEGYWRSGGGDGNAYGELVSQSSGWDDRSVIQRRKLAEVTQ